MTVDSRRMIAEESAALGCWFCRRSDQKIAESWMSMVPITQAMIGDTGSVRLIATITSFGRATITFSGIDSQVPHV
jgi:hypothetical protein